MDTQLAVKEVLKATEFLPLMDKKLDAILAGQGELLDGQRALSAGQRQLCEEMKRRSTRDTIQVQPAPINLGV